MLQQEYLPQGVRVQCQVDAALYQRVLSMVGREEAAPYDPGGDCLPPYRYIRRKTP